MDRKTIKHLISWSLILSAFWLVLSGFLKPLLLSFGVASVALVVFLIYRMNISDAEKQKLALNLSFLQYIIWLSGQIALSSIQVAKLVWGRKAKLSPATGKLPLDKIPKRSRVLYANSITLTPGTLSIDLDNDHVTVHALNEDSIKELRHGDMTEKVYSESKGEI